MIRLKRQLHLTGESVARLQPRVIGSEMARIVRVEVSAASEDLASVSGYGRLSEMRGSIDLVEMPLSALRSARGFLALIPSDGEAPTRFHIELPVFGVAGHDFANWHPPFELWVDLEPPADPRVDPTDPWVWDVEREPTLPVHGFAGGGNAFPKH